jgi:glycosyltransferase
MVKMRVGGASNRSLKNIIQKSKEDLHAIKKNEFGNIFTLVFKNLRKVTQFIKKQ